MKRAISSSWRSIATLLTSVFVVALTASPALAGKPSVAILGLEVLDPTGNVDVQSIQLAKDLTEGMRNRAKAGSGPYQLVAGGDKELIDEKLIHNCDNEAIPCMAEIGKNLGAEFLVYGRVEKKANGFVVTINLLDVSKKKFEKAKTPFAVTANDPATVAGLARRAYNDLTGITELGTLVVTANAETGTVLLDDAPKGTLSAGTATITGLKESRYRLVIEADGYKRSPEVVVTVRSGETATQAVTLEAAAGGDLGHEFGGTTSATKSNIWKPVFYGTVVGGAASGAFWLVTYLQERSAAKKAGPEIDAFTKPAGFSIDKASDFCGDPVLEASTNFAKACKYKGRTAYGIVGVGVFTLGAAVTGYLAFGRGGGEAAVKTTGRRVRKQTQFSVTPILSPEGGGATVQIDW